MSPIFPIRSLTKRSKLFQLSHGKSVAGFFSVALFAYEEGLHNKTSHINFFPYFRGGPIVTRLRTITAGVVRLRQAGVVRLRQER